MSKTPDLHAETICASQQRQAPKLPQGEADSVGAEPASQHSALAGLQARETSRLAVS
jgi:hypothetical protein